MKVPNSRWLTRRNSFADWRTDRQNYPREMVSLQGQDLEILASPLFMTRKVSVVGLQRVGGNVIDRTRFMGNGLGFMYEIVPPSPPEPEPGNQAPTDILLSASTIAELSALGTLIGTLSTVDPNTGDVHSYSLVAGRTDLVALVGNQLQVGGTIDFETDPSFSITVRTTDLGGLYFEKAFTITVTDVDEDLSLSGLITVLGGTITIYGTPIDGDLVLH